MHASPPASSPTPGSLEGHLSHAVRSASSLRKVQIEPEDTLLDSAGGAGLLERVLDEIDYGVLVLSAGRWVTFANRALRQLCDLPRSPCHVAGGQLKLADALEQDVLDRALFLAATEARRNLVRVTHGDQALLLATVPLGRRPLEASTQAGDVLVLFSRRQTCEALSMEFFARAFGLTHAETAVLCALCRGAQPTQVAHDAGVAVSTVRTQVSSIRQKTGASSIGELVRQVAVLPPIVPALLSRHAH